jgi:hypothetical protein
MTGKIHRVIILSFVLITIASSCINTSSGPAVNPANPDSSTPSRRVHVLENRKVGILVSNLQWDQWVFEQIYYGLELEGAKKW